MAGILTLPNALSASRIVLAPVLLVLAAKGHANYFLGLLAFSLFTDAIDGYLARLLHQTSNLGVRLDSWGDLLNYITMGLGLWLLWPETFLAEMWFLLLGVGFYCLPMVASLCKFGTLPKYHTWAAKLAALLIAPAYFVLALWQYPWFFRGVILFHVWVALEELLIVFILQRNQYNVPSFIHARNLTRRARARLQVEKERLQEKHDRFQQRRHSKRTARRNKL